MAEVNTDEHLSTILESLGLSKYLETFRKESVLPEHLAYLIEADLQQLVPEIGPRAKLRHYVESLCAAGSERKSDEALLVPGVDVVARFKDLLRGRVRPKEAVVDVIVKYYSARLLAISTPAQTLALYKDGEVVPTSRTRARLLHERKIRVGGPLPSTLPSGSGASFFLAFENGHVPKVLKLFASGTNGQQEVRNVESLGQFKSYLVPCEVVPVEANVSDPREKAVRCPAGLLMPYYPCTAASLPIPVPVAVLVEFGKRMLDAVGVLHSLGYAHLDFKPSNIFLDHQGLPWLGDFGSLLPIGTDLFDAFVTPGYLPTTDDLSASAEVDFWMLAVTLLELEGTVSSPPSGLTAAEMSAAIDRVKDEALRTFISQLVRTRTTLAS